MAGLVRLVIDWLPATLPEVEQGRYAARTLSTSFFADPRFRHPRHRDGLPIVVAFTTEGRDVSRFCRYESMWSEPRVGLASALFNFYRVNLDDMTPDLVRRFGGGDVPVVLFLDERGREIHDLRGWRVTSKRLVSLMSHVVKARWNRDLGRIVTAKMKLLRRFDDATMRLNSESLALARDESLLENKPTSRLKRGIEKRRKAILRARRDLVEVSAAESALLSFLGVAPSGVSEPEATAPAIPSTPATIHAPGDRGLAKAVETPGRGVDSERLRTRE